MKFTVLRLGLLWVLFVSAAGIAGHSAQAAVEGGWEQEWQELRQQMKEGVSATLKKEVEWGDENTSEEEKSTSIKSYDIDNAIPVWTIKEDMTMLRDYHKSREDFSKVLEWSDRWYIPAVSMTGSYASILVQKEKDGYKVYGQYFGEDEIYMADTADEVKEQVEKALGGIEIAQVRTISIPFYQMNLIYVRQDDGEEKVIPYQEFGTTALRDIHEESEKAYPIDQFISDMENAYVEYTDQEIKKMREQSKSEIRLGGGPEPKKRASAGEQKERASAGEQKENASAGEQKENASNGQLYIALAVLCAVGVGAAVVVGFAKRRKNYE